MNETNVENISCKYGEYFIVVQNIYPSNNVYLLLSHYITMSTKRIYRKTSLTPIFWVFELCGKFAVSLKMPASVLTGVELGDLGDSQVCGRRISVMPP